MLRSLARRFKASSRLFAKSDSGSSAVEFAMVSFVFFYVLGVIFETGLMMFTEYSLQASVQQAQRLIRTGQAQKSGMNADAFKSIVCETAKVVNCMGKVNMYVNSVGSFSALNAAKPAMTAVGPGAGGGPSTSYNPGTCSMATAIIVTYDWDFVLPFMDFFANVPGKKRRLVGFSIFRNEPFCG
jgi:Flp pilus assembly protein TadG